MYVNVSLFFFFFFQTWKEVTGREIKYVNIDVAKEYELLLKLFKEHKPDTVSEILLQWDIEAEIKPIRLVSTDCVA